MTDIGPGAARARGGEMKIAVVGAGISGLVAARLLCREHEVTVFEAEGRAGGHTHTVDAAAGGETHPVDTGFIVYNEPNYPHFTRLLAELGVATKPTTMSFSVRCETTGLEWNGSSLNRVFAQRRNLLRPRFWRMLRDILRFNRDARAWLRGTGEDVTVGEWLATRRLGGLFASHYLLPLGAAIWSCPAGSFREFPFRFVAEFLENHRLLQLAGRPEWRVVEGGSRRYLEPLVRPFADRIRLASPVRSVRRGSDAVEVALDRGTERFDEIVVAAHADQALAMLSDPTPEESEVLSAFPYQRNDVVLHTDCRALPERRLAWGAWNFHVRAGGEDLPTLTYQMNILQGLRAKARFNVTLNETDRIDPERVLRRLPYAHPVYVAGRAAARARHGRLLRANRTSFCGAYWGHGFHEDGVRSAVRVAEAWGIRP